MQESARERKAATPRGSIDAAAEGERAVQAKIAGLPSADRAMAERIHTLVTDSAPDLVPRTYYGMPAYAKGGKVICFFKPASKFNVRYATFEFQADASLDDGDMWPVAFAVTKLTARVEARIGEFVRKAVG
jgi:uncharacterized protein YdhG (YjbR/CyaY superfamily)